MVCKFCSIFTILLLFSQISLIQQQCLEKKTSLKSIIRGNYKNVLQLNSGGFISSRGQNYLGGNNKGICIRDEIYTINGSFGYVMSYIGYSIQLDLIQNYELNTLKLWFWDQEYRFYLLEVYGKFENKETKVYQSNSAQSIVTITFPDQQVKSFRIYNKAGNTQNSQMDVIKAEAYYKLQTNIFQ